MVLYNHMVLDYGIHSKNIFADITNAKNIVASTTGAGAVHGILSEVEGDAVAAGVKAKISNSGSIIVTGAGNDVYGIYSKKVDAHITNSGLIESTRYGVAFDDGGTLNNSGSIKSSGTTSDSYAAGGGGAITISNSGSLLGSVENGVPAIKLDDGGNLELKKGSFVVGGMLLGGATSISIDSDQHRSLHYVFGGDGAIKDDKPAVSGSSPVFYSTNGREVTILDAGYLNADIDALASISGHVSGLIRSRHSVKDASKSHVWISGTISGKKVGDNEKTAGLFAAADDIANFSVGVDGSASSGFSVGGLLGSNMGKMDIVSSSYDRETGSLFAAVHTIRRFDNVFVQTALSGGFLKHDDVRFIQDNTVENGIDRAASSYSSYWYSPEITLGVAIKAADWTYTPSANLRYASQSVNAYVEKGSQSNMSYDSRSISLLSGRAGLAVDRQFSTAHLTLRTGYQSSFGLVGATNVSLSMLEDSEQTFPIQTLGRRQGIYSGVDVGLNLSQKASVTLGGEAVFSKDKMDTHLTAGLDVAF